MARMTASSSYAEFFRCPMKRWLYTEQGGMGIVAKGEAEDTLFGTVIHNGVETLLKGGPIDDALEFLGELASLTGQTPDGYSRYMELMWLGEALLRVFNAEVLPLMRAEYEFLAIEQELAVPIGSLPVGVTIPDMEPYYEPLLWCCRPDVILRRHLDGKCFNCNLKTSGYIDDIDKLYEFSVQTLMEAWCVKRHLNQDTQGTVLVVFGKGIKGKLLKQDKDKGLTSGYRRDSPFTYVWWKAKDKTWSYERTYGAYKRPAWEVWNSVEDMLKVIPVELQRQQVFITDPISQSTMDVDDLIKEILQVEGLVQNGFKVRAHSNCNNDGHFNRECPYKRWCWGTDEERATLYEPRVANHPIEETLKEDL